MAKRKKKAKKFEYAQIDIGVFKHRFRGKLGDESYAQKTFDAVRVLSLNPRLSWYQLCLFKHRDFSTKEWVACEFRTGIPLDPLVYGTSKNMVVKQALVNLARYSKDELLRFVNKNCKVNTDTCVFYTKKHRKKYLGNYLY